MHEIIPLDQIKPRLDRIGVSPNRLAQMAGLSHTTLNRILSGEVVNFEYQTLVKICRTLIDLELALRDDLVKLHPLDRVPASLEAAE